MITAIDGVDERNLCLTIPCTGGCGETKFLVIDTAQYDNWQRGHHIQDAFPQLSAADRELMISGICGPCFAAIFTGDDD